MSDEQPPVDVPAPAAEEVTALDLPAPVPDEPAPEAEAVAAPAALEPVLLPSADLINALAAAASASAGAPPPVESAPLEPVDLQNRPINDYGYQSTTPLPHGGRPIPKQTAAGALLTGGFNTYKVYIGNLPETATLADLEDCFGQLGECTCSIKRGFGFVEYVEPSSAAEAVAKYHEGHFLGAQIKVELSHARAGIPKAPVDDDGKPSLRNPPGSDRPSDARKPMHINGPPGGNKRPSGPQDGRPGPDYLRDPPRRDDRYGSGPPRGNSPPYDRYRDDYRGDSRGPPPSSQPYPDQRYGGRDNFDRYGPPPPRDFRGPPPPAPYGAPRDGGRPYENSNNNYYDAPPRSDYSPYPVSRPLAPYGAPPPSDVRPYGQGSPRSSREYAPMDRYNDRPLPLSAPASSFDYDSRGPPPPLGGGIEDRYDPRGGGGADRYPVYDDRRNGGGGGGGYGGGGAGRSPYRSGPPMDRRRSLSPRRGGGAEFRAPPEFNPQNGGGGGAYAGSGGFDGGRGGGQYDEYVPRR